MVSDNSFTDNMSAVNRIYGTHAEVAKPDADGNIDVPHIDVENQVEEVEEPESYDPGADNIDEVKAYVEENPDDLDAVLVAEREGKERSTLIEWLEAKVLERDED